MTTANNASSTNARPPGKRQCGTAPLGQWWKVWVLLTSVGATMIGWIASGPSVPNAVVLTQSPPVRTESWQVSVANTIDKRATRPGVQALTMPRKPVFQAPVTRTRRS